MTDIIKIRHAYQTLYETISKTPKQEEHKNKCLLDLRIFFKDYMILYHIGKDKD